MHYQNYRLQIDNISFDEIAQRFGTPTYVYSKNTIHHNWLAFKNGLADCRHQIFYAVKANSNLCILSLLAKLGSGFDIVSLGELKRVLAAGGSASKIVFSGVGKSETEIISALKAGIHCFNVESRQEIMKINILAGQLGRQANVSLRVNPNVDPQTHQYISTGLKDNKFGIDRNEIHSLAIDINSLSHVQLIGLSCHIGSQVTDLEPFKQIISDLISLQQRLETNGIQLQHLNIGGGLGIAYPDERPPGIKAYTETVSKEGQQTHLRLFIEPGRAMIGNAGYLLTRVLYIKHNQQKYFAITDAGMSDFLRPALYQARHNILPVILRQGEEKIYDIVGPICESSDFLAKNCELTILEDDLLVIDMAGAYGSSMSSNYNSRPRVAEVMICDDQMTLIRQREQVEDLYALEMFEQPD